MASRICAGCGGVIGRDCFNPQECEYITRSMADASVGYAQEVEHLRHLLTQAQDRIIELEHILEQLQSLKQ